MSQSCFSLGFLSQNSLWKLSTFRGYKGIYSRVYEKCEKSVFIQTGHFGNSTSRLERVASLSCESELQANCLARLEFFVLQCSSCHDPSASLHAPHVCHFGDFPVASQSQDSFDCTHLKFSSHSLTHNPYIKST